MGEVVDLADWIRRRDERKADELRALALDMYADADDFEAAGHVETARELRDAASDLWAAIWRLLGVK